MGLVSSGNIFLLIEKMFFLSMFGIQTGQPYRVDDTSRISKWINISK